jgi:dTDP-4-dehydrorhamnose reductase
LRILLTGAAGQLGRALGPALRGHDLIALDRGTLDIADLGAVRAAVEAHRPDLLLNAAAYNDVDGAESQPETAFRVNAVGPRNLALATAERSAAILHVSTDYVFDGEAGRSYHEYDRPNPLSVYGASKLAGEVAVRELNPRHFIVRTAWLYAKGGRNFPEAILAQSGRESVRVVGDQVGSPTYAPHLADAIARLLATSAYGTYHLAGAGAVSWFDVAQALYERLGIATAIDRVTTGEFPRAARRPRYSALTTLQEPRIVLPPWEEGLEAFARMARG